MIFLDANIPMYSYGAQHPNKAVAQRLLEEASVQGERLVTSAEVLQEILHRYSAIRRPDAIQPCFDLVLGLVSEVFAVDLTDVEAAKQILADGLNVSARDALHIAVMRRHGVETIMSFDRGFDRCPGLTRLG
jgi:predicted nucleic acid-binding protein